MNQETQENGNGNRARAVTIAPARLPYHPALEERFGVGQAEWRALVDAIFPLAKASESIILALSYCRARKLDPFKRVVHIVPMWNSELGRMVETVWPGIGELRTTAFRTRQYAGRDSATFGPTITKTIGKAEIEFPEWCQITAYRVLDGQKYPFPGPRVYWMECYAQTKKDDATPNSMWRKRPFGQLDKCAEAAALRAAFPEEIGNDYAAEEMEGKTIGVESTRAIAPRQTLTAQLDALSGDSNGDPPHDPGTGEIISKEMAARARWAQEAPRADDSPKKNGPTLDEVPAVTPVPPAVVSAPAGGLAAEHRQQDAGAGSSLATAPASDPSIDLGTQRLLNDGRFKARDGVGVLTRWHKVLSKDHTARLAPYFEQLMAEAAAADEDRER